MKNKKQTKEYDTKNIGKWYLNNGMKIGQKIKDSKEKFINKK